MWGGVTPLYVDPLWTELGPDGRPAEYLRVVSTGPLSPLVLALTTLGEGAWVGVSFRTAAIPRDRAERLVADLRQCLEHPESCVTT